MGACSTVPEPGLQVQTTTTEIREIRRIAVELLLANHDQIAPLFSQRQRPVAEPGEGLASRKCGSRVCISRFRLTSLPVAGARSEQVRAVWGLRAHVHGDSRDRARLILPTAGTRLRCNRRWANCLAMLMRQLRAMRQRLPNGSANDQVRGRQGLGICSRTRRRR